MSTPTLTPTGLAIARDGMKFTFTWKISDKDHDAGQSIEWRTNKSDAGKWTTLPVNAKATSKTVTLTATNFRPTTNATLTTVSFRIRGRRAAYTQGSGTSQVTITPDWSEWARKDYTVDQPKTPSGSTELTSPSVCKFSWVAENVAKNNRPFYNVLWHSVRVSECMKTNGSEITFSSSKPGWLTNTSTSASGNRSITEDTAVVNRNDKKSYTRWFRVRAQGAGGVSNWRYLKHVYAYPKQPVIITLRAGRVSTDTVINLTWEADSDPAHPIDTTAVEYVIAQPTSGFKCPSGLTWSVAREQADTAKSDGARVVVSAAPGTDNCMWARVNCIHDSNSTPSEPWLVKAGPLNAPTNLSVTPNSSTHKVAVSVTRNCQVPDSRMAIIYRTDEPNSKDVVVGVVAHGTPSATVQCPAWADGTNISIGVYEFQGDATSSTVNGVTTYAISANMKSSKVWSGGSVPQEPGSVTASASGTEGEVILTWAWTWTEADATEISWSQNPNAWESTDEPETYMISNLNQPRWRVSNLETGVRWYFRLRFANRTEDDYTYGPYCDAVEVDLTSAPITPVLMLSEAVITQGETFTASWAYTTTDGTQQAYADICEATIANDGTITYGSIIAHTTTAQHADVTPGWNTGTIHYLCVRVTSESGHVSEWSTPTSITVADPISCTISQVSTSTINITDLDSQTRSVVALQSMPMTVTVTGAGTTGHTTVVIERADEYHVIRPDGSVEDGYAGETIALMRQDGEAQMTIAQSDLIGLLDDGAPYRLIATVEDSLGQTATAEHDFEVHWSHQAKPPASITASVTNGVASISAAAPTGTVSGDVIDIYRLSADKPELIVQNGSYGTTYTDPYPTIGEFGGHRVVSRTLNGDYITSDGTPAWTDVYTTQITDRSIIIDFDGRQLRLPYNIELQNKWKKDFEVTNYLGGSQQGDWSANISRTGSYSIDLEDDELIQEMRILAAYSGICHIRTPEGSSYAADIQVNETHNYSSSKIVEFALTVTRVDPETLDGR